MHLLWLVASLLAPAAVSALRVLGLFPYNAYSHGVFFTAMMEALVERGHHVTMLSPFPRKTSIANYTDLDTSKDLAPMTGTLNYEIETSPSQGGTVIGIANEIVNVAGNSLCRMVFENKQFQNIMNGTFGKFDVVLTEIIGSDCLAAVAYKLKVPLIGMVPYSDLPWMHARVGSVDNPAYNCNVFGHYYKNMNFFQRFTNVFNWLATSFIHKTRMLDASDELVREYLGPYMPPLADIVRNTSLILVNRHVSLHRARPAPPAVVHVGGLHVRASARAHGVGPGLRRWLDQAEHGVILFSMGSLLRSTTLPKAMLLTFVRVFSGLPQRVLWKLEADLPGMPANVRIERWLPQADVLAHRNVVLFITHGGQMGTTEAVVAGVPMLGIPLFADQTANMNLYESLGVAQRLDHWHIREDDFNRAVKSMTEENNRYLVRAREVSALYLDRPQSVEAEAVWWVEYVVRHRGAPHLRPLGADLPWYQYLLLDVAAAGLAVAASCLAVATLALSALCRFAWLAWGSLLGPSGSSGPVQVRNSVSDQKATLKHRRNGDKSSVNILRHAALPESRTRH